MIITHDNNGYIVDKEIYYINKASIYLNVYIICDTFIS